MKINAHGLGLVLGLVMVGWHVLWSVLVATGGAQWVINFVFWIHFITPVFRVGAFDPLRAVVLVVITGVLGYVVGWIAGLIWNAVHRIGGPSPVAPT